MATSSTKNKIMKLSTAEYTTLSTTGTLTKDGVTYTYSPSDTIYVTPDMSSPIIFTNVSATFTANSDTGYEDYDYKAVLTCQGVTASMLATVIFSEEQATSGNYALTCVTGADTVTIYSNDNTAITVPTVIAGSPVEVETTINRATVYDWALFDGVYYMTDVPILSTDRILVKFKYRGDRNDSCIIGNSASSYQANNYYIMCYNDQWRITGNYSFGALDTNEHELDINGNTGIVLFDGTQVLTGVTWNADSNYTVGYRAQGYNGTSPNMQIKEFKVYDANGNLKIDAYPCKVLDMVKLLYDNVSGDSCTPNRVFND